MYICHTIADIREFVRQARDEGRSVGFVPTMGYLHEGHLELMRLAKKRCDTVVASIFVNPTQFGPNEDFDRYPRDLERDAGLLAGAGVDAVFNPPVEEIYPPGYATYVVVERLTEKLCGLSRPGHFRGVTTIVAKLFNIVRPDRAVFGQKDAQQALVLKKMTADLDLGIEIVVAPIVREPDGLAMSSRNVYLDPDQRRAATVLYQSLLKAQAALAAGETRVPRLRRLASDLIEAEPLAEIDYVEIYGYPGLEPADTVSKGSPALLALAVRFGQTRLIDNIILEVQ